ncbi:MAG: TonB-dependent receptor [Proteobacteria bacterium]|nr:TonB-dependent receptor [Pseudomonadota bacterium]NOG59353.1 TonB-dependent receptor [Pseudomonadota bacterium]
MLRISSYSYFLLLLISIPFCLPADEIKEYGEMVVSATRWETIGTPTASSISVINSEEIKNSGARSVVDLLRGRGGIQVNDQYGDGSRATISMRGFGANAQSNSLILVDGRRLNNTDLAAPSLSTISLKDVERIEIIQGSSAVLFGDHAVGGVINIVTRQPEAFRVKLEAGMGSYSTQTQTAHVQNVFSNGFSFRGSYQRVEGDNYRDNNEKLYLNGFGTIAYDWHAGQIFFEHQDISEDINLPGAIFANQVATNRKQTRFPNDYNSTNTGITRVGGRYDINNIWQVAAEFTNRRANINGNISGRAFVQDRHNRSFNPRVRGRIPFNGSRLDIIAGFDLENVDYGLTSAFGVTDSQEFIHSLYLQSIIPISNNISLTAGLRHAWHKEEIIVSFGFANGAVFKDEQFIPTIGLTYKPNENWRFNLKYEENYRFPLIDEGTNVPTGVVGLNTQSGESYEASIDWNSTNYASKLVLYHLALVNEIDFDPTAGAFGGGANTNLDPTDRNGLIFESSVTLLDSITLRGQYSYVDAVFDKGSNAGNLIPFVAEHQASISVDYEMLNDLNFYVEVQAIGERVASGDYANSAARLPGYAVANLSANYDYNGFNFSARLNNVLDKEYSDNAATAFNPFPTVETGFYPAPERNFFLSIGYTFD